MFQSAAVLLHSCEDDVTVGTECVGYVSQRSAILLHAREHSITIMAELVECGARERRTLVTLCVRIAKAVTLSDASAISYDAAADDDDWRTVAPGLRPLAGRAKLTSGETYFVGETAQELDDEVASVSTCFNFWIAPSRLSSVCLIFPCAATGFAVFFPTSFSCCAASSKICWFLANTSSTDGMLAGTGAGAGWFAANHCSP